jgi:hypothetical protein
LYLSVIWYYTSLQQLLESRSKIVRFPKPKPFPLGKMLAM